MNCSHTWEGTLESKWLEALCKLYYPPKN